MSYNTPAGRILILRTEIINDILLLERSVNDISLLERSVVEEGGIIMKNINGFEVQQIIIESQHITEEKECINNFIDHYKLFCNEIGNESSLKWIATHSKVLLYTAYLNQRRDTL
jgi:hypothetical protein